ncbi:hypothetical protein [Synechococcus sp. UW105]|uniref:hypothetical protein n=1 Tax=Synechococcus sp. UW105 TaxID=337067 RepID=UPI000E0F802B|nr:hypothetical protein [Synechococcus sp. UW105]
MEVIGLVIALVGLLGAKEVFFSILLLILSGLIWNQSRRLTTLQRRLEALETPLKQAEKPPASPLASKEGVEATTILSASIQPPPTTRAHAPSQVSQPAAALTTQASRPAAKPRPSASQPLPSNTTSDRGVESRKRWQSIERNLLKNWTGLIGVLAIVSGVSFVGISSLLVLQPFQRFLLLELVCVVMAAPSFVIQRGQRFHPLAVWLRSGAGGLQLFAAAASSSWPALGLAWNESILVAISLMGAAIGANLLLAAITASPWMAAAHVVIAMVPSIVAAPSITTMGLVAVISAFGIWSRAGRHGPSRVLISVSFIAGELWLQRQVTPSLAGGIALLLAGVELPVLHLAPPDHLKRHPAWRAASVLITWLGLALLLGQAPIPGLLPGVGMVLSAFGAVALVVLCGRREEVDLMRLNWCAALVLAISGLGQILAPLNTDLFLICLITIVCTGFVWDACRRGDRILIRNGGYGLLLLSSALALLLPLEADRATVADLPLILLLGLWQQRLVHRLSQGNTSLWLKRILAVVAVVIPAVSITLLLPTQVGIWVLTAFLLASLRLSGQAQPLRALRVSVVSVAVLSWIYSANVLLSEPWTTNALGTTALPLLILSGGMAIGGQRLQGRLIGTRSIGLVLSSLSLVLTVVVMREALGWPATGLASLWWLLLAVSCLGAAKTMASRGFRGEVGVFLGLSWAALICFVLSRLAGQPFNPWLPVAIDSSFIGALILIRQSGHRIGLDAWRLWRSLRQSAGDLAVLGTVVLVSIRLDAAAQVCVLALLTLAAWRCPPSQHWPRQKAHGVVLFLSALIPLAGLQPALSVMTVGGPCLMVLAAATVSTTGWTSSQGKATSLEVTPWCFRWIDALAGLAANHPQRLIAAPLSIAIVVMLAQMQTSLNWLTLLWSVEALILYGLSLLFRDRPLRLTALVMLGLCLVRLVGWDMRRADMTLRGIVFTGVGVVLVTMNIVSTRFER